jgi:hypothetical protein
MSSDHLIPAKAEAVNVPDALDAATAGSVRAYCSARRTTWNLQVRARERLASGKPGTRFMVASAHLGREEMVRLKKALDLLLAE